MAAETGASYTPPISDAAVQAKTGRTWAEWFAALDQSGAARLTHKEIVAVVRDRFGAGPWWQQMVTVTYEQARGLRAKHETAGGYQVSITRTYAVPLERLYHAWATARARGRWLAAPGLAQRGLTAGKSVRFALAGGSRVEARFYARGEGRSQVQVQHSGLPNAAAVKRQRAFWTEALGALRGRLETPRPAGRSAG